MKRIKIMLIAITLFAAVGGSVAFKVTKGSTVYCGAIKGAVAGSPQCPTFLNSTITATFVEQHIISWCSTGAVDAQSTCSVGISSSGILE